MGHSVHSGPIRSIFFTLVLFGLFCTLQYYSVNIGPIWSSLQTSILFSPIWSRLAHSIYFGPNLSIHSYSVNFAPIQSPSVIYGPFGPSCYIRSYFVCLVHFVPFGSIWSIRTTSVHFGSLQSIFVHLIIGKKHVWVESTYILNPNSLNIYINLKLVISKISSIVFIVTTLLLRINVVFHSTLVWLNLSESLFKYKGYKYTTVIFRKATNIQL